MTAGIEILLNETLIVAGFCLLVAVALIHRKRLPAAVLSAAWIVAFLHGYITEAEFWIVVALAAAGLCVLA